jgi:beta-1,4-galactosyltransferase 2
LIVVEQTAGVVFNKGALFNIGYLAAKGSCDYLVLHDIDQVPLSRENKYRYAPGGEFPLHLCSATSQYGYALQITVPQFERINGYSNFYFGWGQEDDDLYFRIAVTLGTVARLDSETGRYQALTHPRVKDLDTTKIFNRGTEHLQATRVGTFDIQTDGISNLKYEMVALERWNEYDRGVRKIVAKLTFDNMPKDLDGNA